MNKLMLILPLLADLSVVHPAMTVMDGSDIVSLCYLQQHSDHMAFVWGDTYAFADYWRLNTSTSWTMSIGTNHGNTSQVSLLTGPFVSD